MSMSMSPTRPGRPRAVEDLGEDAGEVDREGALADAALAGGDGDGALRRPSRRRAWPPAWPAAGGAAALRGLDGELDRGAA